MLLLVFCFVLFFFITVLISNWRLTVCLSVSPRGLQPVLPVYRSVFQSVRSFVGEPSSLRGPKMPESTSGFNQYCSLKSAFFFFKGIFGPEPLTSVHVLGADTHRSPIYWWKKYSHTRSAAKKNKCFLRIKRGEKLLTSSKIHQQTTKRLRSDEWAAHLSSF